jgi:hypothetical protein
MALSAEDMFNDFTKAYKDIAKKFINENTSLLTNVNIKDHVHVSMKSLIAKQPALAQDQYFKSLYPDCFMIAWCELKKETL